MLAEKLQSSKENVTVSIPVGILMTKKVIGYINCLPKTIPNSEIGKQLVRSSGSVGANFIEAEEALSKKDFIFRVKISRKEAKESTYWLKLSEPGSDNSLLKNNLISESIELMKIFGSIVSKAEKRAK